MATSITEQDLRAALKHVRNIAVRRNVPLSEVIDALHQRAMRTRGGLRKRAGRPLRERSPDLGVELPRLELGAVIERALRPGDGTRSQQDVLRATIKWMGKGLELPEKSDDEIAKLAQLAQDAINGASMVNHHRKRREPLRIMLAERINSRRSGR